LLLLLDLLEMEELSFLLSFAVQWDWGWPFFLHLKQGLSLKYSLSNGFFLFLALFGAFFSSPSLLACPSGQMLSPAIHCLLGLISNIDPRTVEPLGSSQVIWHYSS
jgi:hypothetical protein